MESWQWCAFISSKKYLNHAWHWRRETSKTVGLSSTSCPLYYPRKYFDARVMRSWDETINDQVAVKWNKWLSDLPRLSAFEISRSLRLLNPSDVQLQIFSNASMHVYAIVAYLVFHYTNNRPTSPLIASKCRLAPLKTIPIPRLELMEAILSIRLVKRITQVISVKKTVFWTDFTNAWHWVGNTRRNFKPLVANRISEIHETTDLDQWKHLKGETHPADLSTRGLWPSKLWPEGPEFLQSPESE